MAPIPTASIEQHGIAGSSRYDGSRESRNRLAGWPLRVVAMLLAHSLATLTLLLSLTIWSDWRSPEESVNPWLMLALALLLCLNPFAALAIGATLISPADVLKAARSLRTRLVMTGHRTSMLLFSIGFSSAVFLGSAALILLLRLA